MFRKVWGKLWQSWRPYTGSVTQSPDSVLGIPTQSEKGLHTPVMLKEVLHCLDTQPGQDSRFVNCPLLGRVGKLAVCSQTLAYLNVLAGQMGVSQRAFCSSGQLELGIAGSYSSKRCSCRWGLRVSPTCVEAHAKFTIAMGTVEIVEGRWTSGDGHSQALGNPLLCRCCQGGGIAAKRD
ncbi:hypothetical protein E1301_Tti005454 [Triplophysa tibetana]|uniref:Uncharacterized protein n=1 Tax=Triplophysa tibetana TaxID=1572043 RepID=A0A5A9PNE8_9TELE|nr:hypothetical protein E1301_Tti005454 [Triplophysa tibetana]